MEDSMIVSDGDYRLRVFRDEYAASPRDDECNLGKMYCWHSRYNLGDKHEYADPQEFYDSSEYKNAFVILPLYLYDHSGITMSTTDFNDRWDSGQVGYIIATKEQIRNLLGKEPLPEMKEEIERELIAETKNYDAYLQGDCYAYEITDETGGIVDSCCGFYGDSLKDVLCSMKECNEEHSELFRQMEKHTAAYAMMM